MKTFESQSGNNTSFLLRNENLGEKRGKRKAFVNSAPSPVSCQQSDTFLAAFRFEGDGKKEVLNRKLAASVA